ncbi:glycoside hydrolase family 5 protein [Rhizobium sp. NFR12]|uniref:glycoside hydrolase family 5 protein n=1 Tax=Rhizobium sp. NFR12 TaxID=1566261 RepID=UPI000A96E80B|nr:glycoside hydrolase family 5 protein [Rhizobium sp. NFR12]
MLARSSVRAATAACPLIGVNLAGAEFGMIGGRWKWPHQKNMEYYLSLGVKVFRVPFKWNRLQPDIAKPPEPAALEGLDRIVERATGEGAVVLLDMHDYGRRDKIVIGDGTSAATLESYAAFWGELAQRYGRNSLVWYGLMNEPHDQDPILNLNTQNAACAEIRRRGATGTVLFSGIAWTGAHSWTKTSNGTVMLQAFDPADNYGFDMHQYLDKGFGGSNPIATEGIGKRILKSATDWATQHRKRIFIGEFATGRTEASLRELRDLLDVMMAHPDIFLGATYWAGGGVWGNTNQQTVDPPRDSPDIMSEQLKLLLPYVGCRI